VDPIQALEVGDPNVDDAVDVRDEVEPALRRAARDHTRTRYGPRETHSGIVFVDLALIRQQDGDGLIRIGSRDDLEIVDAQATAF
ncbi:MAG: hypothetical protein ACJ778_14030, partial [Chloroflexota bacterium]